MTYYLQPPPLGEVTTGELNRYLVSTQEVLYHYRCPTEKPTMGKLERGHYLIDIEPRCVLDASLWMIKGLPTTEVNLTMERPKPEPVDLSWFKIPNHTDPDLNAPFGVTQLDFPNYEDLHKPPVTDIVSEVDNIQKDIERSPTPWYIWLTLAIAGLIALVIGLCYLRNLKCGNVLTKREISNPIYSNQTKQRNSKFQSKTSLDFDQCYADINRQPYVVDTLPKPVRKIYDPIGVYDSETQTVKIMSRESFLPKPEEPTKLKGSQEDLTPVNEV